MSKRKQHYLEDQRKCRLMDCDTGVDHVWYMYRAMMKSQRLKERHDLDYVMQREQSYRGKSMGEIEQMMLDSGEIPSTSPESMAGSSASQFGP
jgi:hypothetical protein